MWDALESLLFAYKHERFLLNWITVPLQSHTDWSSSHSSALTKTNQYYFFFESRMIFIHLHAHLLMVFLPYWITSNNCLDWKICLKKYRIYTHSSYSLSLSVSLILTAVYRFTWIFIILVDHANILLIKTTFFTLKSSLWVIDLSTYLTCTCTDMIERFSWKDNNFSSFYDPQQTGRALTSNCLLSQFVSNWLMR